jgi:hypothetical protein
MHQIFNYKSKDMQKQLMLSLGKCHPDFKKEVENLAMKFIEHL